MKLSQFVSVTVALIGIFLNVGCGGGATVNGSGNAVGGSGLTANITVTRVGTINIQNDNFFPVYVFVDGRYAGILGAGQHYPMQVIQGSHTVTFYNGFRQQVDEFSLSTDGTNNNQ